MDAMSITIGVCAMEKKAGSKPMKEILHRLEAFGFIIHVFQESMILEEPVESWPLCDCMIAFFSTGFPLEKAEAYSDLHKPYVVNDLHLQWALMDRVRVYEILAEHGVPTPRHLVLDHSRMEHKLIDHEDHMEYGDFKLRKPIVEKPRAGDDHNVRIYWPKSSGGGCTKLFRKVGDRSSEYCADVNSFREDGVYVYEEFVNTQGVDVKVYTCGPDYAHAEARKAPAVDGRVCRNRRGKEERYPVILSADEKRIARTVVLAFKQNICGMDLLRSKDGSFVCDVNGWSFVKDSTKYWDDTALSLRNVCLNAIATSRAGLVPLGFNLYAEDSKTLSQSVSASPRRENLCPSKRSRDDEQDKYQVSSRRRVQREKLLCVSVVARHADRTPKQKMKMTTTHPDLLRFCKVKSLDQETKLKQCEDLKSFLETTRKLLEDEGAIRDSVDVPKLHQLKQVLEMNELEGLSVYRKIQLKPKQFHGETLVEAQLILKWGGQLTWAGKNQAIELGHRLRVALYPSRETGTAGAGDSLLRLHATYRHDLKIYSSDEGRVMMSAAAFAKGLLDLESNLPPIASMLLQSDENATLMLDIMPPSGRLQMDRVKQDLSSVLHSEAADLQTVKNYHHTMAKLERLGNAPLERMRELQQLLTRLVDEISERRAAGEMKACPTIVPHMCHSKSDPVESLDFLYARWSKLQQEFFDGKAGRFEISKIPDIYDCSLYDMLHNEPLQLVTLPRLHETAHSLANFMVPLEYGITEFEKSAIGISITKRLVQKLLADLNRDVDGELYQLDRTAVQKGDIRLLDRRIHTRLYFTSESHILSLLNVIRWGHERTDLAGASTTSPTPGDAEPLLSSDKAAVFDNITTGGMAFLTHLVITVHESFAWPADSLARFRVRILFSPGANGQELSVAEAVPLTPPEGLALPRVSNFLRGALAFAESLDEPSGKDKKDEKKEAKKAKKDKSKKKEG